MTAREYLQQYGEAVRNSERLKREYITELELIDAVGSTLGGDGLPHGNGISRKTEDKAIRLAEKAAALRDARIEAIRIRQEIFETIQSVPGAKGEVLYERYIKLKSWDEIAEAVGYTKRHARNIHDEALTYVEDFLLFPPCE